MKNVEKFENVFCLLSRWNIGLGIYDRFSKNIFLY